MITQLIVKFRPMRHLLVSLLAAAGLVGMTVGQAQAGLLPQVSIGDDPPDRSMTISEEVTVHQWWIIRYDDGRALCEAFVDHDGNPTDKEIFESCGQDIYLRWSLSKVCAPDVDINCERMFIQWMGTDTIEKQIEITYPSPEVGVSLTGCAPGLAANSCMDQPTMTFRAEELFPGEEIVKITVEWGMKTVTCDGGTCTVEMPATGKDGVQIGFWADSTLGDSSEVFLARVRAVEVDDETTVNGSSWQADLLSEQRSDGPPGGCSLIWDTLPSLDGLPDWLVTPGDQDILSSDVPFTLLAGRLINQGIVDASACDGGGLLSSQVANNCGLSMARSAVSDWQNSFDSMIFSAALRTGVPAQLMKNLFAHESQFWPAGFVGDNDVIEAGLGQLTENGADTVLLWNPTFYAQFCPQVLGQDTCAQGYGNLANGEKNLLTGALMTKSDAFCETCAYQVSLDKAGFSVDVFAEALLANCEQIGRVVSYATNKSARDIMSYEDLWRITLANYNGGPGCLNAALEYADENDIALTWSNLSKVFPPHCQGAVKYVEAITY